MSTLPYENEMFWPATHPGRPAGHWARANEREWTAEEIVEFIKKETNGLDPVHVTSTRVLLKKELIPEKTKGGIIMLDDTRETKLREITVGKVLDWGNDAFRYKRTFPSGRTVNRGDYVTYKVYEETMIPLPHDPTRTFELVYVHDDKLVGACQHFDNYANTY